MDVEDVECSDQVSGLWSLVSGSCSLGPVTCDLRPDSYQLAFRTPGIIPDSDSSRKQMRQRPKRRRNARERPQRPHRLWTRTSNFGFRLLFSIMALRAISNSLTQMVVYSNVGTLPTSRVPLPAYIARPPFLSSDRNGMPSSLSSA